MDSIRIDTGVKRVCINDNPEKVIEFNPSDVIFAEKFYQLIKDFELKQTEFINRSKELDANKEIDENGLPVNLNESIALLKEVCNYFREKIDGLFGEGSSQKAFGDSLNLDIFEQFFEGILPFIEKVREEKVKKYVKRHK